MNVFAGLGLRARLALALIGVAVAAVVLATVLANRGLDSELDRASRERVERSARHLADVAADIYVRESGWTPTARRELEHLARIEDLAFAIDGRLAGEPAAQAPVAVQGRRVATLRVAPSDPVAYAAQDDDLHRRLNRLHVLAGILAGGLGLLAAVALAVSLARPLKRLTAGASRMELGRLDTRIEPGGGPEIEQLAHALNRLAETLEREEQLRRETTADVAHELRTPLTGIVSRIEAAQDHVLSDEVANLEALHAEAMRLTRLVDDLGRLADAQQPGLLVAKEVVDLAAAARRRVESFAPAFAEKRLELHTELKQASVAGDHARLDQVIDNLLSNALRYTDRGGRVTVRTRMDGDEAVLQVADTGIGIAPDDLPHVFERFWRSDKSRARTSGGAGIGLAIVRELVRAHDGRIDISSTPGEGTTMTVRLPRPERSRSVRATA